MMIAAQLLSLLPVFLVLLTATVVFAAVKNLSPKEARELVRENPQVFHFGCPHVCRNITARVLTVRA